MNDIITVKDLQLWYGQTKALKGVSMIDAEGQPFYGPEEDAALFKTLKDEIDPAKAEVVEMDAHVNDDEFAIAAAQKLIDLMEK